MVIYTLPIHIASVHAEVGEIASYIAGILRNI